MRTCQICTKHWKGRTAHEKDASQSKKPIGEYCVIDRIKTKCLLLKIQLKVAMDIIHLKIQWEFEVSKFIIWLRIILKPQPLKIVKDGVLIKAKF